MLWKYQMATYSIGSISNLRNKLIQCEERGEILQDKEIGLQETSQDAKAVLLTRFLIELAYA